MRVLLIYPTIGGFFKPSFHAGLASISAVLKQNNHLVELFILSSWADQGKMLKRIKDLDPGVIGFSATASTFPAVKQSSQTIKKIFKKPKIVCGGVHTTIFPQGLFEAAYLDGICLGEGEYAMLDLVNSLEQRKDHLMIDGFWFRQNNRIIKNKKRGIISNLDLLPFPDREIFAKEKILFYKSQPFDYPGENGLEFIFSRGCSFDCHYCSNHALRDFYGPKYVRRRSPQKAVQEIVLAVQKYRPDYLQFHDDIFGLNKDWLNNFLYYYKKSRIDIPFNCNLRPGAFSKNMVMSLKNGNCRGVLIGLESGDTQIRKKILNRQVTNKQMIKSFCLARKGGLKTFAFCMMGFPEETPKKFMNTIKLLGRIHPDNYNIQIFYPYPGTRLFKLCQAKKLFRDRIDKDFIERKDTILNLPLFKREDIIYFFMNFFKLVDLNYPRKGFIKNLHRKTKLYLLSYSPSAFFFRLFQFLIWLDGNVSRAFHLLQKIPSLL